MKVLHTVGKKGLALTNTPGEIVVFDDIKDTVGKDGKPRQTVVRPAYYSRMDYAVRGLAGRVADDKAATLHEWLLAYREVVNSVFIPQRNRRRANDE